MVYPILLLVHRTKNISVKDAFVGINGESNWSIYLSRNLNNWEMDEY